MDRHKTVVSIFAVLIIIMIAGEAMIYVVNPYNFSSDVISDGGDARYEVESSGSARFQILEFDAGMSRQDAEHLARRLTGYEGA